MDLNQRLTDEQKTELLEYLSGFVSDHRIERFRQVLPFRTRYMTILLEDIFQSHNASAVLRSCECYGIQDVHLIENRYPFDVNPEVALGAAKWITLVRHSGSGLSTRDILYHMKDQGYRIVATSPHDGAYTQYNLPLDQKFVLLFGTELTGLTSEAVSMADHLIRIPMVGFTESLNISVSAAILISSLSDRLRQSDYPWQLSGTESNDVLLDWLIASIKKADLLVEDFINRR